MFIVYFIGSDNSNYRPWDICTPYHVWSKNDRGFYAQNDIVVVHYKKNTYGKDRHRFYFFCCMFCFALVLYILVFLFIVYFIGSDNSNYRPWDICTPYHVWSKNDRGFYAQNDIVVVHYKKNTYGKDRHRFYFFCCMFCFALVLYIYMLTKINIFL